MKYWMLKTEPSTYSFANLVRDGQTTWDHIRNYAARNFVRAMAPGDAALVYHSGGEKAVVGGAAIASAPYPEPGEPEWTVADVTPVAALKQPVTLAQIKAHPVLGKIEMARQPRLSVSPLSQAEYEAIVALGGGFAARQKIAR